MDNVIEIKNKHQDAVIYALRKDVIEIKNSINDLRQSIQELILKVSHK